MPYNNSSQLWWEKYIAVLNILSSGFHLIEVCQPYWASTNRWVDENQSACKCLYPPSFSRQ